LSSQLSSDVTKETKTLSLKEISHHFAPDWRRSLWQLTNSILPYIVLLGLMYNSLEFSYLLTLLLAIPAAGFFLRIFMIFHDCGHGSFFNSAKMNTIIGYLTGLLTFAPYHDWRFKHARHHATCSDLDRRGVGDVWTLTIGEYDALPRWERFLYRLYRNPVIMFGLGPIYLFMISYRVISRETKTREKRSVHLVNFGILLILLSSNWLIGLKAYLMIQLPVIFLAGMAGVWLFYVQHQFEETYWERHASWDFFQAALQGSSFYKLPKLLQWFTGNIGYHHVHHLNARIPNYYLQRCHEQVSEFRRIPPLTFLKSLQSLKFRLWDENAGRMVGFSEIRKAKAA
jgi:omega-6 fatty acid desaturase (delta-12 desaturase)